MEILLITALINIIDILVCDSSQDTGVELEAKRWFC